LSSFPGSRPGHNARWRQFAGEHAMADTPRTRSASREQLRRRSHEAPLLDRMKWKLSRPNLPSNAGAELYPVLRPIPPSEGC
jgi:hypothetical protein